MNQLETPITIDEAIAHLATAKAPGTDGLPLEFYSQFREIFVLIFVKDMFKCSKNYLNIYLTPLLSQFHGKDPSLPESYRPHCYNSISKS